jgi:transcriptional regulator with XRE-family HTH domain
MATPHAASAGVRRALRKLGADIHDARIRRHLTMAVVADRAFTTRATLQRVEAGDPAVGMGIYASVLQALGLLDGLAGAADRAADSQGQLLVASRSPKRVRFPRERKTDV